MNEKERTKFLKSLKQSKRNKLANELISQGKKPIIMSKKEFKKLKIK